MTFNYVNITILQNDTIYIIKLIIQNNLRSNSKFRTVFDLIKGNTASNRNKSSEEHRKKEF